MNNFKENYMDEHLPKRVIIAGILAIVFMAVPLMLFYIYFRFFDNTPYYTVIQPIPVAEKWYKPCDDVVLTLTRSSLIDLSGSIQTDLVLKQNNNVIFKVPDAKFTRTVSVSKGDRVTVSVSYPLPCNLADGLYYWQITLTYRVRGFEHAYNAVSDTFNVNQYGLSPEVIKAATSAAELQRLPVRNPAVRISPTPQPTSVPSQNTTIINNNPPPEEKDEEQPTPQQPNPPIPSGICLPFFGCIR